MIWVKRIASHLLAGLVFTQVWLWLYVSEAVPIHLEDVWRMVAVVALIGLVVAILAELDAEQTG